MSDRASGRLYALLQRRLWPAAWRRQLGAPAREAFDDLMAEARQQGNLAVVRLWARELRGLIGAPRGPKRGPLRRLAGTAGSLRDDGRFALRQLSKHPGLAAIIVVTLAIGLGAASAAVAVADAILLRPLPWSHPDELVQIWTVLGPPDATDRMTVSPADWADLRSAVDSFADVAAHNVWTPTLVEEQRDPVQLDAALVTPNFFDLMGVSPLLGSGLGDQGGDEERAVVLGYRLWRSRYNADPAVIGRRIELDGRAYQVRGVLPANYRAPEPHRRFTEPALYAAFSMSPEFLADRGSLFLRPVGRLRPGVTLPTAQAEAAGTMLDLARRYPETNSNRTIRLVPLRQELLGGLQPMAAMILGAAMALLAIVWANIANLLLVRAQQRSPEMGLRAALGAPRLRLLQQLLVENGLLAIAGGTLGFAAVRATSGRLANLAGTRLPALLAIDVDGRVGATAALLVALTALGLTGLAMLGLPSAGTLSRVAASSSGRVTARFRSALAAGEIGVAVALLIAATLLTQSLVHLTSRPTGLDPVDVYTFDLVLPREGYGEMEPRAQALAQLQERLAALPAVRSAGIVSDLPFTPENRSLRPGLGEDPPPVAERPRIEYRAVSGGYFATLGITTTQGRVFVDDGPTTDAPEAVVNEAFVERYLRGDSALGTPILFDDEAPPARIVGVVRDVRDDGYASDPDPMIYLWQFQVANRHVIAVLGGQLEPVGLAEAVRGVVREVEPFAIAGNLRSMEAIVRDTLAAERMAATLALTLSGVAVLLAALGIYGVMAHLIESRTREIGVRTALGATPRDVLRQVIGQALRLAVAGALGGILIGWAGARGLASLLFEVGAEDPFALLVSPLALMVVALVASWIPARRAARVSPIEALRAE